mgnify:CR=1 FL=1
MLDSDLALLNSFSPIIFTLFCILLIHFSVLVSLSFQYTGQKWTLVAGDFSCERNVEPMGEKILVRRFTTLKCSFLSLEIMPLHWLFISSNSRSEGFKLGVGSPVFWVLLGACNVID